MVLVLVLVLLGLDQKAFHSKLGLSWEQLGTLGCVDRRSGLIQWD